jgi:hypothetical protein
LPGLTEFACGAVPAPLLGELDEIRARFAASYAAR